MTDHVAIMKKSWGLTQKIVTGHKTIESRWYKSKVAPWGKIRAGDTVYFKDSGEQVTISADVKDVLQFENLTPAKVKKLLEKYYEQDGIAPSDVPKFVELFKDKKYCMLIFLENAHEIPPFDIDKTGFGLMAAWLTVEDIKAIKK